MSSVVKRKTSNLTSTSKGKKQGRSLKNLAETHDKFDSSSDDSSDNEDELGVSIVEPTRVNYSDYSKDIKKSKLLADEMALSDSDSDGGITINEQFKEQYTSHKDRAIMNASNDRFMKNVLAKAKRLEDQEAKREKRRQRRQLLAKRQELLEEAGIINSSDDDDDNDSESSEDESGKFMDKRDDLEYITLLQKLKTKDPSLYSKDTVFFTQTNNDDNSDNDDTASSSSSKASKKGTTYRELMAEAAKKDLDLDTMEDLDDNNRFNAPNDTIETLDEYNARQALIKASLMSSINETEKIVEKESKKKNKNKVVISSNSDDESYMNNNNNNSDDSDDDLFGAPKVIYNPDDENDNPGLTNDNDGDNNDDDDDTVSKVHYNKDYIAHDVEEAKKVLKSIHKTQSKGGIGVEIDASMSLSGQTQQSKESQKEAFLMKYILGEWWKTDKDTDDTTTTSSKKLGNKKDSKDSKKLTKDDTTTSLSSLSLPSSSSLFGEQKAKLLQSNYKVSSIDSEDDIVVDASDIYEQQLNFRHEDDADADDAALSFNGLTTAGLLLSHPRNINDSLRRTDDRRKLQRQRKLEREKKELLQQQEMAKRIHNLSKKLVNEKLSSIIRLSGDFDHADDDLDNDDDDDTNNTNKKDRKMKRWTAYDLTSEFDPDEHDRRNREIYNNDDDDDQQQEKQNQSSSDSDNSDSDSDVKKDKEKIINIITQHQHEDEEEIKASIGAVQDEIISTKTKLPTLIKDKIKKQREKENKKKGAVSSSSSSDNSDSNDSDSDSDSDSDDDAIIPTVKQLDQLEQQAKMLANTLKSRSKGERDNIRNTIDNIFTTEDAESEAVTWWDQQKMKILSKPHNVKLLEGLKGKEKQNKMKEIIRLELEEWEKNAPDVIDTNSSSNNKDKDNSSSSTSNPSQDLLGGFKFHYVSVPAHDFGLDIEEILTLSDKELNQRVNMKRYAAYDDTNDTRDWKQIQEDQRVLYKEYMTKQAKNNNNTYNNKHKSIKTSHINEDLGLDMNGDLIPATHNKYNNNNNNKKYDQHSHISSRDGVQRKTHIQQRATANWSTSGTTSKQPWKKTSSSESSSSFKRSRPSNNDDNNDNKRRKYDDNDTKTSNSSSHDTRDILASKRSSGHTTQFKIARSSTPSYNKHNNSNTENRDKHTKERSNKQYTRSLNDMNKETVAQIKSRQHGFISSAVKGTNKRMTFD